MKRNIIVAKVMHATIEKLLDELFSVRSVQRLYLEVTTENDCAGEGQQKL
jgi:hypothetical protein